MTIGEIYTEYFNALLAGNRTECKRIVNELLQSKVAIKDLYVNLFQATMYEVGLLWESNRISVATEHLCTTITESMISLCYPALFSSDHCGKKAVISCTPGEYHQLGARMVADFFEMYGWDGYFLGADVPSEELISYIRDKRPDMVALSISVSFNIGELRQTAAMIREAFPDLPIIAGGQGFRWGGETALDQISNVTVVKSLDQLVDKYLMISA